MWADLRDYPGYFNVIYVAASRCRKTPLASLRAPSLYRFLTGVRAASRKVDPMLRFVLLEHDDGRAYHAVVLAQYRMAGRWRARVRYRTAPGLASGEMPGPRWR